MVGGAWKSTMKSSRMAEPGESLQLLVDPMCNLFAGLVLLSVFLALFAGKSEGDPKAEPGRSPRFANEELLRKRIAEIAEEMNQTRSANSTLSAQTGTATPLPPLRAVEKALAEADQASPGQAPIPAATLQQALESEQERLRQQSAALANEIQGLRKETTRLRERSDQLSRQVPARAGNEEEVRVRLPRARPTEKIPLYLLLAGGKIYPVQSPNGAENDDHVDRQRSPMEDQITPRAGQGLSAGRETDDFLRRIDVQRCYPVLVVYADSFPQYQQHRKSLEAMNLPFGWEPRENGSPLRLSARGFKPEAQ